MGQKNNDSKLWTLLQGARAYQKTAFPDILEVTNFPPKRATLGKSSSCCFPQETRAHLSFCLQVFISVKKIEAAYGNTQKNISFLFHVVVIFH